ncbi:hypothetical protein ACFQ3P_39890 [Paraburkholderia sabiae]|uniref:Nicotinamide riboside transporter PnuC n=1 Tax=Paraburkholderia sabiae TaxID=273251 RepID=A0ABU9QRS8_9BURK|nr:hypothetical protein [Paraburkholderia sabiae]WJZ79633.1 hypothetical protein QEN71_40895 [Paraburkholderia sabiae]CAD6562890.1 hypothetical protein LMG24235_08132 [Paraburkholderia sabiae]
MNAVAGTEVIEQALIGLCGALAVFLSQDSRLGWRRWACIFGLVAQPFWLDMAWRAHQYGVLALSLVYTASWARGLAAHWLMRRED